MNVAFRIIIAAFSVLGIYLSAKVIFGMIFPNEYVTRAITVDEKEKLLSLDLILREARAFELCSYRKKIILAIKGDLFSSCNEDEKVRLYEIAEKNGVKIVFY